MKTKFKIFSVLLVLSLFVFTACEKQYETSDLSTVTNYPVFQMTGASVITIPQGTAYTEPGIKATAGTEEVAVTVSVVGIFSGYKGTDVNTNVPDRYTITYSASNSDGFVNTVTRTVWVAITGDLVNSIEGLYTATIVRNGVSSPQYTDLEYVLIWKKSGNTYSISDAIGGYYALGRAYGDNYMALGMTVTANDIPSNDFTYGGTIGVGAFGGALDMTAFSVNSGAKTIDFTTDWDAGYTFVVTLTQVQL
jgi:hypothetical protein